MAYDCGNCGHHWTADKHQESCPKCQTWYVMTTDEWSEQDAFDQAIEEMGRLNLVNARLNILLQKMTSEQRSLVVVESQEVTT
tara:strand:- start:243 stop:491 length:249 start_codon:yes stop_codon:yes gene_type:complete